MHHRNERNAIIQHGTMTLCASRRWRASAAGREWCICEDAELGLRLMPAGHEHVYVDEVLGRGPHARRLRRVQGAALPLGVRRDADPEAPLARAAPARVD